MQQEAPVEVHVLELIFEIIFLMINPCLFHLMRESARTHITTCATSLMRVKIAHATFVMTHLRWSVNSQE